MVTASRKETTAVAKKELIRVSYKFFCEASFGDEVWCLGGAFWRQGLARSLG